MRETQSVSLLPLSIICKGDDKKLRLFSRVSLATLSFIFQGCETKSTSFPWLWEHPQCRVVVVASDLGSSLKALCWHGFFQTRRVGWKLIESPSPKPTGQEGAGATLKLVFLLRKKQSTLRPGRRSLNRYQVFSLAGIKKYVDSGQIQGKLNFDS